MKMDIGIAVVVGTIVGTIVGACVAGGIIYAGLQKIADAINEQG
jgi:hypothetical protein